MTPKPQLIFFSILFSILTVVNIFSAYSHAQKSETGWVIFCVVIAILMLWRAVVNIKELKERFYS